jgi:hypothetical protein
MVKPPVGLLSWSWGKNADEEIFGERNCAVHFDDDDLFYPERIGQDNLYSSNDANVIYVARRRLFRAVAAAFKV